MLTLRRLLPPILGALSLFLILASSAMAAPEFLDGTVKGLKFTFTSGEGTLNAGGLTIKSPKDTGSGEVTGAKTVTATIDFEEYTLAGLALISLGDTTDKTKGGLVLVTLAGELCTLNTSPLEIGVHFLIGEKGAITEKLHLEVPALGELLTISGSVIGRVTTINELRTTGTITLPSTPIASCKKDSGATLSAGLKVEKAENKKPEAATLVSTESLTFAKDIEIMG